jgi:proline racemase
MDGDRRIHDGILLSVGGRARITGHDTIFAEDCDPSAHGFQIR